MAAIRALERDDLPAVSSLYEHIARSGSRTTAPGLVEYFERSFFEHPWFDPDIPSLVYVDEDGEIAGFLGSSVRRIVWNGRPQRLAVAGQLVTEPRARSHAAGMFLTREFLRGQQDLTVTDTASDAARRIWERLGGDTYHLACIGWIRVFQPVRFSGEYAARREMERTASAARGLARVLDPVARRVLRGTRPPRPRARTEALTPAGLVENLPNVAASFAVAPAYDEEFARWLLSAVAEVDTYGTLVSRLVRSPSDDPLGWFVYYVEKGAIGSVLQVAAGAEHVDDVLDALFDDAYERGAAGVQGRIEGVLREPLARKGCRFHQSGYLALIHSSDPALLRDVHAGKSLLTRLEGEWWMGHHLPLRST